MGSNNVKPLTNLQAGILTATVFAFVYGGIIGALCIASNYGSKEKRRQAPYHMNQNVMMGGYDPYAAGAGSNYSYNGGRLSPRML